jgi:hypothetical protein
MSISLNIKVNYTLPFVNQRSEITKELFRLIGVYVRILEHIHQCHIAFRFLKAQLQLYSKTNCLSYLCKYAHSVWRSPVTEGHNTQKRLDHLLHSTSILISWLQ